MVDTISNAKSIRHTGSATARYGAPPATSDSVASTKAVAPASALADTGQHDHEGGTGRQTPQSEDSANLRLEVAEDGSGKDVVYRFVDAKTGDLVRQWDAGEFGKLRDYLRDKKIHLLDKKV